MGRVFGVMLLLVPLAVGAYCLQTTATPVQHEVGPGGQSQAGPCM